AGRPPCMIHIEGCDPADWPETPDRRAGSSARRRPWRPPQPRRETGRDTRAAPAARPDAGAPPARPPAGRAAARAGRPPRPHRGDPRFAAGPPTPIRPRTGRRSGRPGRGRPWVTRGDGEGAVRSWSDRLLARPGSADELDLPRHGAQAAAEPVGDLLVGVSL